MPTLELHVEKLDVVGLPDDGNLVLDPPVPGLDRVLLRRLFCLVRVATISGARKAYLDTGSPLSIFPHRIWHDEFLWQPGRDFDELSVAGVGPVLRGQVLSHHYSCRLVRL